MADLPSGDGSVDPRYGDMKALDVGSASDLARPGETASPSDGASVNQRGSVMLWCLVPIAAVGLFVAVSVMVAASLAGSDSSSAAAERVSGKLAPYWIVKAGQTYAQIAAKTGLSIDQLEAFNPHTDPGTIAAGQRIKLRLHVPPPRPKPLGARYWTVRSGQSFGSIAARTGRDIGSLQRLNPRLKATGLQPGSRVRLRR